ncbi:MAG: TetR/AcrR family transcriptional regulator [Xanthomonadaceae bacterium]|nr:TetR/AcrR family transcriptional regulator [Xanthomonadaceae bacterium]
MGIATRREREKSAKKTKVLETAKQLFETRGITQVTMHDIAAACEYSIGSLYLYFKSKDDIYMGLAALGSQQVDDLLKAYLGTGEKLSLKKTEGLIEEFLEIYGAYGYYFDVLRVTSNNLNTSEFSKEIFESLSSTTMSAISVTSHFFSSACPESDKKSDIAMNSTFTAWAFLLGIAQMTAKGRGALLDENSRRALIGYAAKLFSDGDLVSVMSQLTPKDDSKVRFV